MNRCGLSRFASILLFIALTAQLAAGVGVPASTFRARLPEHARLGIMAVAFIVAVRDREAGVAPYSRKSLKKQTRRTLLEFAGRKQPGRHFVVYLNGEIRMATVVVNQGESIESALRRFKRKVMSEEIIKDAKKHAFFMSRGQKAKLKSALARKRNKRKVRPMRPRS
jgi:small subunit ribosomal protein S21